MDGSLPGSSIHGIFQARILLWVAISFSRGSSRPRDRICRCFRGMVNTVFQGLPWWSSGEDSMLPPQGARVRSLVGELRSCMLPGTANTHTRTHTRTHACTHTHTHTPKKQKQKHYIPFSSQKIGRLGCGLGEGSKRYGAAVELTETMKESAGKEANMNIHWKD